MWEVRGAACHKCGTGASCITTHRRPLVCWPAVSSVATARAGNRRLGLLSPLRTHINAPYKTDLLWETLRALTAVTGRAAQTVLRSDDEFTRARTPGRCASAEGEALA